MRFDRESKGSVLSLDDQSGIGGMYVAGMKVQG